MPARSAPRAIDGEKYSVRRILILIVAIPRPKPPAPRGSILDAKGGRDWMRFDRTDRCSQQKYRVDRAIELAVDGLGKMPSDEERDEVHLGADRQSDDQSAGQRDRHTPE